MVSSSVRTMSFLSNQTVSTRKEVSSEAKTDEFAKMMDQSINKAKDSKVSDDSNAKQVSEKTAVSKDKVDDKFKEKVEEKVEEKEPVEEVSAVEELNTDEEIPKEVSKEVSEEILNIVAMILGVNVNELKSSMEELNISSEDLIDMEQVTKLVMDMKNVDTKFDLLINEDASNAIKDITKAIEDVVNTMEETLKNNEKAVDTEVEIPVLEVTEELPKEEKIQDASKENMSEDVHSMNDTNVEAKVETSKQEFNFDEGKDGSKETKENVNDNVLNQIGDIKGNILNEIENALNERVDASISTRIINQITDNITVAVRESLTSLEMQLYPEHLGKVSVILASEENGITAKITAETEMAKNAIEQQLTLLKENFEKQGLKVADIEVTIASHGFEQNLDKENNKDNGQQKRSRGIRQSLLDDVNGDVEDENLKENIVMQTLGNTVSYLA